MSNVTRAPFRARATALAVAEVLPDADEAAVRDVLARAGGDIGQALATLAAAMGTLVGERADESLHPALLGGAARRMAEIAVMRGRAVGGRA